MARRTKYPAVCYKCKKLVPAGKGCLHRQQGKWYAHCDECIAKRNK